MKKRIPVRGRMGGVSVSQKEDPTVLTSDIEFQRDFSLDVYENSYITNARQSEA